MAGDSVAQLDFESSSAVWGQLCERMEAFLGAWESAQAPPEIAAFLPEQPGALRTMVLVELVKIDLEYRWRSGGNAKRLEDYVLEFPELGGEQALPADLIYEEFRVRKQAHASPALEEYRDRFPDQAQSLERLLALESPQTTTRLRPGPAPGRPRGADSIDDDFEVRETLRAGTLATLYLARQRSMQRLVALQVAPLHGEEMQQIAMLDHPNVVRVLDQRRSADGLSRLLYMEWLPGGTLEAVLDAARAVPPSDRSGRLFLEVVHRQLAAHQVQPQYEDPLRQRLLSMDWFEVVAWLGLPLCAALEYAHAKGILHGALKPASVFLTASGAPKLADFGSACRSKLDGAAPSAYFDGSLAYMSPEQMEACSPDHPRGQDELDGRSDLFALGMVLWELLAGARPFADEGLAGDWTTTVESLIARRRRGPGPEAMDQLPPQSPACLREALLRCVAPDPESRPRTARELSGQLRLALQPGLQQLLRAPEGGWLERLHRRLVPALLLAGILPNAMLSLLVIAYNWVAVVSRLDQLAQRVFLGTLLTVLNGFFYGLAVAVGWWALGPILRAIRSPPLDADLGFARQRSLTLGHWVFWTSLACWAVAGGTFPVCLELSGGAVGPREYVHFFASHLLSGLIAGTLCFFLLTYLSLRFVYPRLLAQTLAEPPDVRPLAALRRRVAVYERVAAVVPFVSAILLGSSDSGFRGAFVGLAVIGAGGLLASFRLSREIQSQLATLLAAGTMENEGSPLAGDAPHSFGSRSR